MRVNKLKASLKQGKPVFGFYLTAMVEPAMVEIMGLVGFDYVVIDMEHGICGFENLIHMVRSADAVDITPLVRIPRADRTDILRCLETGAGGFIVPHVKSEKETLNIVKAARYAPQGSRGYANVTRAGSYSLLPPHEYTAMANAETIVGVQIEDKEALTDIRKIFSIKGLDLAFIGPYDLAQSMGFPINPEHPQVVAAMEEVIILSREYKHVTTGIHVATPAEAKKWLDLGARLISCSNDTSIFLEGCKSILKELKSISQKVKNK